LICRYFDCESGDRQPALFCEFYGLPNKAIHRWSGATCACDPGAASACRGREWDELPLIEITR
jgi:hypothetical protein